MSPRISHPRRGYGAALVLAAITASAVLGACGPDIQVRTAVSPEANTLAGRQTFRVVEASKPANGDGHVSNGNGNGITGATGISGYGINDPMVENSITSQAVHDQIKSAFEARGYRYSADDPDFEIRYYATIAPILDIRTYNYNGGYGYGYYDGYANDGYGYAVATYDRGTVIIDAVNPSDKKLLWRGQGTSGLYTEPKKYMKELRYAVRAIAKKFPPAGPPPVPLTAIR